MTWRQWLDHLKQWWHSVLQFPGRKDSDHFWVGEAGGEHWYCMICKAEKTEED